MFGYLIVFVLIIFTSSYELVTKNKIHPIFYYLMIIGLISFAGLRGEKGNDTIEYISFFENIDINNFYFFLTQFEPGFVAYALMIKGLLNSSGFFIFMIALLSITLQLFYIRKLSPLPLISLIPFMSGYYLSLDMGQIRQALAMGFVIMAFYFFIENQIKKFYFLLIIACCFHISASIFFVLVFLRRNVDTLIHVSLILGSFLLVFFDIKTIIIDVIKLLFFWNDFIFSKLMSYSAGKYADNIGFSSIHLWYIIVILIFLYYRKLFPKNGNYNLVLNVFSLGIVLNFIFNSFPVLIRCTYYFLALEGVLIGHIIYKTKYSINRYILWVFIFSFGFLRYYMYLKARIDVYI